MLLSLAEASHGARPERAVIEALVAGRTPEARAGRRRHGGRCDDRRAAARTRRTPTR